MFILYFFVNHSFASDNCALPERYVDLCNYQTTPVPDYVIDTKGEGYSTVEALFNSENNITITDYLKNIETRFPMQEILNLAFQGNSDAMVYLAMAFENKDWREYWLNKALYHKNLFAFDETYPWEEWDESDESGSERKYELSRLKLIDRIFSDNAVPNSIKKKLEVEVFYAFSELNEDSYSMFHNLDTDKTIEEMAYEGNIYAINNLSIKYMSSEHGPLRIKYKSLNELKMEFGDSYFTSKLMAYCFIGLGGSYCGDISKDRDKAFKFINEYVGLYASYLDEQSISSGYIIDKESLKDKFICEIGASFFDKKIYSDAEYWLKRCVADSQKKNRLALIYDPNILSISGISSYENLFSLLVGDSDLPKWAIAFYFYAYYINPPDQRPYVPSFGLAKHFPSMLPQSEKEALAKEFLKEEIKYLNKIDGKCRRLRKEINSDSFFISKCDEKDAVSAFNNAFSEFGQSAFESVERDVRYIVSKPLPGNVANLNFDKAILLHYRDTVRPARNHALKVYSSNKQKYDELQSFVKQNSCSAGITYDKQYPERFISTFPVFSSDPGRHSPCALLMNMRTNSEYLSKARNLGSIYALVVDGILISNKNFISYSLPIGESIIDSSKYYGRLLKSSQQDLYVKYNMTP